jgi:hypothetical protein
VRRRYGRQVNYFMTALIVLPALVICHSLCALIDMSRPVSPLLSFPLMLFAPLEILLFRSDHVVALLWRWRWGQRRRV